MRRIRAIEHLVIFFILAMMFSYPAPAPTIVSEFNCNNTDATTSFYSYLREPTLKDSGYTRGLKTGTFNYFKEGDAKLNDTLRYYDGQWDKDHPSGTDHNASVYYHNLDVNFTGKKKTSEGISEFFAKGFYSSNRAASAFKKIYSINYSNKSWDLGGIYRSNKIVVNGRASMGSNLASGDFTMEYHAYAENAAMKIVDATGWTNKTGFNRIDWEQEAMMKGKTLNVTNNLFIESMGGPRATIDDDWLPCCFASNLQPPVEPTISVYPLWPSVSAKTVVQPLMLPPNADCTPYGCTNCSNYPVPCTNCSLDKASCPSFQCIYTTELAADGGRRAGLTAKPAAIDVTSRYETDIDDTAVYSIEVINVGGTVLNNVNLTVDLSEPEYSYMESDPKPNPLPNPTEVKQILTYNTFDPLNSGDSTSIELTVKTGGRNSEQDLSKVRVRVTGLDGNTPIKSMEKGSGPKETGQA